MKDKIVEIIRKACALEETISPESELKLLSLDSLSFVEAIVDLEQIFEIEFDLEEIGGSVWQTVGDIIKSVEEKLDAKK